MGVSPLRSVCTLASSTSTQVTRWPVSAKQVPATRPTYPLPRFGQGQGMDQESVVGMEAGPLGAQAERADGDGAPHFGLRTCAGARRLARPGGPGKAAAEMDQGPRLSRIAQPQQEPLLFGTFLDAVPAPRESLERGE